MSIMYDVILFVDVLLCSDGLLCYTTHIAIMLTSYAQLQLHISYAQNYDT